MRPLSKSDDRMFAAFGIDASNKARGFPLKIREDLSKALTAGYVPDTFRTRTSDARIFVIGHNESGAGALIAVTLPEAKPPSYLPEKDSDNRYLGWESSIINFANDAVREKKGVLNRAAAERAREITFVAFFIVFILMISHPLATFETKSLLTLSLFSLFGLSAVYFLAKKFVYSSLQKKDTDIALINSVVDRCGERIRAPEPHRHAY